VNLFDRLLSYYSDKYLKAQLKRGKSAIYSSILKYGRSKFTLEILEYCDSKVLLERETYYIILKNPEYNILRVAGSRAGKKHSGEAIEKIRQAALNRTEEQLAKLREHLAKVHAANIGRKFSHSEETKAKISYTLSNKSDEYKANHKAKIQAARGKPVTVKNLETNETVDYPSIREAARALKESHVSIAKHIKKSKIFKGYFISYKDL
jgi:group I intron endonuclease